MFSSNTYWIFNIHTNFNSSTFCYLNIDSSISTLGKMATYVTYNQTALSE